MSSGGKARAAFVGELNGDSAIASTRSGSGGIDSLQSIGVGNRITVPLDVVSAEGQVLESSVIEFGTTGGSAPIPAPDPRLSPFGAPNPFGHVIDRALDAEIKLLGHGLRVTEASGADVSGRLYLWADRGMCGSCTGNIFHFEAVRPGVEIITSLPHPNISGAGSATSRLRQ